MFGVWQATVVNVAGDIQPGAQIEVRVELTGALAALFADKDGETPLGNPFSVDDDGFARFYANQGTYRVRAFQGSFERIHRDVLIINPANIGTAKAVTVITDGDSPPSVPDGFVNSINLPFAFAVIDTDGFFDPLTPSSIEITTQLEGYYLVVATVFWDESTAGERQVYITRNGGVLAGDRRAASGGNSNQTIAVMMNLLAGNGVSVQVGQDSGGPLDVIEASLMLYRLGDVLPDVVPS